MSVTESGVQYCKHCDTMTEHRPKMDAAKNNQRVCNECDCCNDYVEETLNRCDECGIHLNEYKKCIECHG